MNIPDLTLARLRHRVDPVRICDPCVGSGRMLLAHAACHPLWLSQIGYLQYFGLDIDPLCVEMCRLNLRLYGLVLLRIEPVTLDTLSRLQEARGQPLRRPRADVCTEAATVPPIEQPQVLTRVVETVNAARRQQLSLFGTSPI